MAFGRFAPSLTSAWLNGPQRPPIIQIPTWAALMVTDPFISGDPLSAEIIGQAYRRPQFLMQFVDPIIRNSMPLHWAVPPMTRVIGIAGFDAAFNGGILWYAPLPNAMDYPVGGSVDFPAQQLYLGVDS